MTQLLIMLGWIVGIATMGRVPPPFLAFGYFSLWMVLLSIVLLCFLRWRFDQSRHCAIQLLQHLAIICGSFFLGHYYADHALTARLALRSPDADSVSAIIYIDQIAQNSQADSKRWQHRVWVLNQQHVPVPWRVSYVVNVEQPDANTLQLGQYYRVTGAVKAAQSYAVAGAFDQERWLLKQNIMASMQLQTLQRLSPQQVAQLGYAAFVNQQKSVFAQIQLAIEQQRLNFRTLITQHSFKQPGLLLALLTGDKSLLFAHTQAQFQRLGISHLLAISGPHVLIFALLFCALCQQLLQRFYPYIFLRLPRPYVLVLPFWFCVLIYTALVGFEIPALRTLLSLSLISALLLLKYAIRPFKLLLISASLLLVFDPFSILSAAFWLSYGACLMLLRVYQTMPRHSEQERKGLGKTTTAFGRSLWLLRIFIWSQWKIFIALFPLMMFIFHQVSWLTPLANVIAIPLIGSVIVPISVLAACLSLFLPDVAVWLFYLADVMLGFLLLLLEAVDQAFAAQLYGLALNFWQMLCLSLAIWMSLLPRGVLPRFWLLLCAVAAVLWPKTAHDFQLNIIDVGQGQAILLQLPQHNIMIDVGGHYNEQQWGVGEHIIVPYLMRQGIFKLDQLILSHLDQDHSGAFERLSQHIKIDRLYSNQQDPRFEQFDFNYCFAGQQWQYGQIKIEILSPTQAQLATAPQQKNERSCVVYIQVPQSKSHQNFLIMGDAGWETEFQLLQHYPDLKVDVLVLGHHGSRHSSSFAFLQKLQPKLAIVSAGKGNRYGHPHALVKARLNALSIPLFSSIDQGSMQFYLDPDRQMQLQSYRDSHRWLQRGR